MKKIFCLVFIIGSWSLMAADLSFNDYFYSQTEKNLDEKNLITILSSFLQENSGPVVFKVDDKTVRVTRKNNGSLSFSLGKNILTLQMNGSSICIEREIPPKKFVGKKEYKDNPHSEKNPSKSVYKETRPIDTKVIHYQPIKKEIFSIITQSLEAQAPNVG